MLRTSSPSCGFITTERKPTAAVLIPLSMAKARMVAARTAWGYASSHRFHTGGCPCGRSLKARKNSSRDCLQQGWGATPHLT